MRKLGIRIKIIMCYVMLAAVLAAVAWMVCAGARELVSLNRTSDGLVERRDVVDCLVYTMLETANAERAILLGDGGEWRRFDSSLAASVDKARRLRGIVGDGRQQQRLDSLVALLGEKRRNVMAVMGRIGDDSRGRYYDDKVEALQSGRDSVVIHPKTDGRTSHSETVYEVVSSRRGFFRRLGDAFRRQHTDTVDVRHIGTATVADSAARAVNIADSVANALAQIRREERRADIRRQEALGERMRELQWVSVLLAKRTGNLLEDIQSDEQRALREAVEKAVVSRRTMAVRIGVMSVVAIAVAVALVMLIMRDIRRERADRRRLVEAKAETERLMQQRERLLLTITHDIKAPAASISGFISLLEGCVSGTKPQSYLTSIRSSADHLLRLVGALLDYHRLESGRAETHAVDFAPAALARECVEGWQPCAVEKGLRLTLAVRCGETVLCRADAFRLRQVMDNLVGNALKYTREGHVDVAVGLAGGKLTLSVSDTGCGMTEVEKAQVFKAFARLPEAQGQEGVGLGLSITREIVQMLGGSIRLESQKGSGSKFTVVVPVEEGAAVKAEVATEAKAEIADGRHAHEALAGSGVAQDKPVTVLVVDDDRLQLRLLGEMLGQLEDISLDVVTTASASEAVRLAGERHPRVIFTDIEMPEMNGSEIRRRVAACGAKVVAMTAHDRSIAERLRGEGFDACLFKPFDVRTLAATLCRLTGIMPRVAPLRNRRIAPLLAFAEGDAEAERQIMADLAKSVNEYLSLLADADDCRAVAAAAHKAMPLLEMVEPGGGGWLLPLTPEHIGETPAPDRRALVERLRHELAALK